MKVAFIVALLVCVVAVHSQVLPPPVGPAGFPGALGPVGVPGLPIIPPIVPPFLGFPFFRPFFGLRRFGLLGLGFPFLGKRDVDEVERDARSYESKLPVNNNVVEPIADADKEKTVDSADKKIVPEIIPEADKAIKVDTVDNSIVAEPIADVDSEKKVDTVETSNAAETVPEAEKVAVRDVDAQKVAERDLDVQKVDAKKVDVRSVNKALMIKKMAKGKVAVRAVDVQKDTKAIVVEPITACSISSEDKTIECRNGAVKSFSCALVPKIGELSSTGLKIDDLDIIEAEGKVDVLNLVAPDTKFTVVDPKSKKDILISLFFGNKDLNGFQIVEESCWKQVISLVGNLRPEELKLSLIIKPVA